MTLGALLRQAAGELAGRDRERAVLLDLVRADRPLVMVVHGLAGTGKSALLEAFRADALRELPLRGLRPPDARRFLERAGVDPEVDRLAHGHPLTLRLASSTLDGATGAARAGGFGSVRRAAENETTMVLEARP